ncbi:MAG: carbon-nitrogen hydrolase family protein [Xanthobacteraceae bacterium]|nr:carbon-nitrogen hydrolase family protein [Xanthobacteraceae bacterium]
MNLDTPKVVVAAIHASAPPFDLKAGVSKTCALIAEASRRGARLVVFPESFIPGFPVWAGVIRPIDAHSVFKRFAENSLNVNSKEFRDVQAAAAKHRIFVSLGFSELSDESKGRLWNSQVLISDTGELVNHHRKLVPTFYEQLAWTRGDAAGLRVVNSPFGRIGGLICGENNNPLARYSLMAQGEEIHCACYPAVWPFRNPLNSPAYDLRDSIRFRTASYSFEAKAFTIVSAGVLDDETLSGMSGADDEIRQILLASPKACSMIVGPTGDLISDILQDNEGMVLAEVDTSSLTELKRHHDMAGYYNREDIFRVEVKADRLSTLELVKRSDRPATGPASFRGFGEEPIVEAAAE